MVNWNATLRYLSICTICVTAQAVKLLEHKLSHLDKDATKGGKQSCVVSNLFRHVEHLFE